MFIGGWFVFLLGMLLGICFCLIFGNQFMEGFKNPKV